METSFAKRALEGKVAIVTGSASGIGRETAVHLASLGAFVWATDVDEAGLEVLAETLADRGITHIQDVTDLNSWHSLVARIKRQSGRLDILVNNAGIMINAAFLATTPEDWRRQQAINVDSVFWGMQATLPLMCESVKSHGATPSIINISSIYGIVAGPSFAAYSASKGAVRALTKAVAIEFASHGVRVNSIHPGPTKTNLGASWDLRDDQGEPIPQERSIAGWEALIPAGRMGVPADIAPAIVFLSSDASRYITGAEFVVDGGYIAR